MVRITRSSVSVTSNYLSEFPANNRYVAVIMDDLPPLCARNIILIGKVRLGGIRLTSLVGLVTGGGGLVTGGGGLVTGGGGLVTGGGGLVSEGGGLVSEGGGRVL